MLTERVFTTGVWGGERGTHGLAGELDRHNWRFLRVGIHFDTDDAA